MGIYWTVLVTVHDTDDSVIGTMEGWQLSDTTLDKIQWDVDAFINEENDDGNA